MAALHIENGPLELFCADGCVYKGRLRVYLHPLLAAGAFMVASWLAKMFWYTEIWFARGLASFWGVVLRILD
jgi:hypothetical protein